MMKRTILMPLGLSLFVPMVRADDESDFERRVREKEQQVPAALTFYGHTNQL